MYYLLKTADRGVRASLAIYLVYHTALKKASIVKPFCVTLVQLRREQAPQAGNRNLLFFCRQGRVARLKPDPSGSQPNRERQNFLHFFYFFISHELSCRRKNALSGIGAGCIKPTCRCTVPVFTANSFSPASCTPTLPIWTSRQRKDAVSSLSRWRKPRAWTKP